MRERVHRGRLDRLLGMALFGPSASLLVLAAMLEPGSDDLQQKIGMGTCTIYSFTGWPCPACGMTTTFSLAAHLRPLDAFLTQPFGFLLFLLTLGAAGLGLAELLRPGGRIRAGFWWAVDREGTLALLILGCMAAGWVYKVLAWQYGWGLPPLNP